MPGPADDITSGLDDVTVAQRTRKTWKHKLSNHTGASWVFGAREISITVWREPDEPATRATVSAGSLLGNSELTAPELRILAQMCQMVADAIDEGTA